MLAALILAFLAGSLYSEREFHTCAVCGTRHGRKEFGFTWRRLYRHEWITRSAFDREVMPPEHRHRWAYESNDRRRFKRWVHGDGFPRVSRLLLYYHADPVFRGHVRGLIRRGELTRDRIERIAADRKLEASFLFGFVDSLIGRFR